MYVLGQPLKSCQQVRFEVPAVAIHQFYYLVKENKNSSCINLGQKDISKTILDEQGNNINKEYK